MNNAQASEIIESNDAYLMARAPHATMSSHVADHGDAQARELYQAARELDALHFGGALGPVFLEIAAPASPTALATHQPRTPEGVACVVRIAPSVVDAGMALAKDALLHEMIHVWQAMTGNREPGYAGHGPKFAAECNRIGALLGLPEVGVKGRGGLPDCAQWPLNVRPEGYYGEAPRATKAVARATKARAARQRPKSLGTHPSDAKAPTAAERALAALQACTAEEQADVLLTLGLVACPA